MKTKIFNKAKGLVKALPFYLFALLPLFTACSPDEFSGADPNGIPTTSGADFQMTVDQEINQMIATYNGAPGTYPVWILNGTMYSTLPEVGYRNDEMGTYTVELKIGNRNGISQAGIKKEFHFNESKIDYSADFRRLCEKEWRFARKEKGHLGVGPGGTTGTEWWSAGPDEKKDFGMYDDRMTFTSDNRKGGTFNYNAGDDGLTYVNKATSFAAGAAEDVDVTIGNQTAPWSFEVYDWTDAEGKTSKQTYIQLAPNTAFPYITCDAQYENPRFRIESLTASKLVLVYDEPNGGNAWHYIFTSAADERLVEEQGFDANSDFNLWKGVTPEATFYFAPGWSPDRTAEMQATFVDKGNDYTVTVPDACADRWQAQMHLHTTDVVTSAASHYDFSCIFVADADIDGVTVKVTNESDNEAIIDVADISLKAGKEYVFWMSDIEGKDLSPVKIVFDFGHAAGATTINISNIVLKDHANDDGTKVPSEGGGGGEDTPVMDWDAASAANLWKTVENGDAFISVTPWFADNGWSQIADPEWKHENGVWSLTIPEGMGSNQWQGQFPINTSLTASKSKKYNFYCVVEADQDANGVTIKFTETDEGDTKHDNNFFFADRHDLKADVPYIFKAEGVSLPLNDAHAMSLFFDFGGTPIGTNIKISQIYFEEAVVLDYNDANNLWKAVDEGSDFISVTPWFADNSWTQIGDPAWSHDGNKWIVTIPEGMGGSQWQGQFPINTSIATAQNDAYNFSCTILADNDAAGVTIKLTETDEADGTKHDNNFYFADRHDIKADEPFVYTMKGVVLPVNDAHALSLFFDFGGTPVGTKIIISDIIFEKAQ